MVVIKNTGTAPASVVTTGGNIDHGKVIAPGATVELEMRGRTSNLRLVCDASTTVGVSAYTLDALREDAAAAYDVPARFLTGTTKTELAKSAVEFKAAVNL